MLTTAALAEMQRVQQASMIDTCKIVTVTTTTGAYGGQQQSTSESAAIRCGLSFNAGRRMDASRGPLAAVDAVLRLPLGTVIDSTSQVKITGRNGAALAEPVTYTVDGPVIPGRTCIVVGLKRVGV